MKLPTAESCCSLTWLPDHQSLLILGNAMGWIKLYDMRTNGIMTALSVLAHPSTRPRKIKGIKASPFDQNILATFSDAAGDIVKIWDLRHLIPSSSNTANNSNVTSTSLGGTGVPSVPNKAATKSNLSHAYAVNPYTATASAPGVISDIAWSPIRAGVLCVATTCQKNISFYRCDRSALEGIASTSTAGNSNPLTHFGTSTPLFSIDTPEFVKSLSWQRNQLSNSASSDWMTTNESDNRFATYVEKEVLPTMLPQSASSNVSALEGNWDRLEAENLPINMLRSDTETQSTICSSTMSSSKRLLGATVSGIFDTDVRDDAPFSYSYQFDNVAIMQKHSIVLSKVNNRNYKTFEEYIGDISRVMQDRAAAGYGVDVNKNIRIITDEINYLSRSVNKDPNSLSHERLSQLCRVWKWIDRCMFLINEPGMSYYNCGALELFREHNDRLPAPKKSTYNSHAVTGAGFYSAHFRSIIRKTCGWLETINDAMHTPKSLTPDSSFHGNFIDRADKVDEVVQFTPQDTLERVVVITLWHGDLERSVQLILDAVKHKQTDQTKVHSNKFYAPSEANDSVMMYDLGLSPSDEYLQTLMLVAMCFAGYQTQETQETEDKTATKKADSTWCTMCNHVISQLEQFPSKAAISYLVAGCKFLLANESARGSKGLYQEFLDMDSPIALEDKLAFAATYLDDNTFSSWLGKSITIAQERGILEGLVLTSLCPTGVSIMQQYLDICDDLQTVTLIISRVLYSSQDNPRDEVNSKAISWLNAYRGLLNKWEMFVERAELDVHLGKLMNHYKEKFIEVKVAIKNAQQFSKTAKSTTGGSCSSRIAPSVCAFKQLEGIPKDILPHLHLSSVRLKCNYCSAILPQLDIHNCDQNLRDRNNIVNTCTLCKKSLPRCYICQLHVVTR